MADYIIIGAGSAGCVLAERLSRDPMNSVLILEAGGRNRSVLVDMPRGMIKLWRQPRYFWRFPIENQPERAPEETWYYGKGLGGSSAVNGTWYFRGQPGDYDSWGAQGNTGWNWQAIEKAYSEMERYAGSGAHASRGIRGPLTVTASRRRSAVNDAIIEAGRQMSLPALDDINAPATDGIGYTQMTVDQRGRRVSAYGAFLRPALGRPNLTVRTGVHVLRIGFEGRRAVSVVCSERGREVEYRATREIIVSAGVIQSPKLLQLSGIGPGDLLEHHAIPVVHANDAVGRNLSEHMMVALSFDLKNAPGLNREFGGWRLARNVLTYFLLGRGPMATNLPDVSLMLSSTGDRAFPDIQMGISPFSIAASASDKPEVGRGRREATPGITAIGFYLRPESRGTVSIRSTDPSTPPQVRANWFAHPGDKDHFVGLVRTMRALMAQPALQHYVGTEKVPGAAKQSDDEILAEAKWLLSPGLHGTGTCRMAPEGQGVVDERLRVRGVQGLRVVDCSIMPTPISGNTNGPAMAVAWHAANLILMDR